MRDFFGCYLLESKNPRAKGRTYIGFTVNPRRRIRQHNGEIVNGAFKTRNLRPWEMVLVVYGFPTQVQALQFEWAWQHPEKSLDVRPIAAKLSRQKRQGVAGKVLLLMEMLRSEPYCYYPLTIQFLSSTHSVLRGKCSPPPEHMQVFVAPLEALPEGVEDADALEAEAAAEGGSDSEDGGTGSSGDEADAPSLSMLPSQQPDGASSGDDASMLPAASSQATAAAAAAGANGKRAAARAAAACKLCGKAASRTWVPCSCGTRTHVECLARHFLQSSGGSSGMAEAGTLPSRGTCPSCGAQRSWMEVLGSTENAGWQNKSRRGKRGAGRQGKAAAAAADAEAHAQQQSQPQGSPAESAAAAGGKGAAARKPRSRKPAAVAAAAAADGATAAGAAAAAAPSAAPPKRRGRPRKLQPLLGGADSEGEPSAPAGSSLQQQRGYGSYAALDVDVVEALPWDDFGLASPPRHAAPAGGSLGAACSPAPGAAAAAAGAGSSPPPWCQVQQQPQQQQEEEDVVELLDSEEEREQVPLAQRLWRQQQQQQQQRQQQRGGPDCPPAAAPARPAAAAGTPAAAATGIEHGSGGGAVDLVSPSPLPLLQRLQRQAERGAQATPSPAPLRKLQKRFPGEAIAAAGAAAGGAAPPLAAALEAAGGGAPAAAAPLQQWQRPQQPQQWQRQGQEADVIVISSDSE